MENIYTRADSSIKKRNAVIAVLVSIFFISIILLYFTMLRNQRRENIIKDGEMAAKEAADQVERYLSTNMDQVRLAAYALDEMLIKGRSDAEIQEYLVAQSTAIRNAVFEHSTGLYGYINGRFFSGTNWIPPADYVATDRPWYQRPFEDPGEITILDPYTDVQSGNTMMAIGKTLCDGESVISLDISPDQMQKLTEEAAESGATDIEMLLDDRGTVIAHSDSSEIGRDYGEEADTLGAFIVSQAGTGGQRNFEFDHQGVHYIVYVAEIENGWRCVSVKDATAVFASLQRMLFVTIAVAITIILIISVIVARSNRYLALSAAAIAENEARSAFLAGMSHEIRTPINAILGMNEMILRETVDPTIHSYAENIRSSGKVLLGFVNDIFHISGAEESGEAREENNKILTAPGAGVLAVDDNPMNLMVLTNLLRETEMTIDTAESGDEGIKLASQNKYDLIFLDFMMPGKDGIETLHEIRSVAGNPNASTPAVCLTANAIEGTREECLSAGFNEYLTKPVDPDLLEKVLIRFIPEEKVVMAERPAETAGGLKAEGPSLPEELLSLESSGINASEGLAISGSLPAYMSLLKVFYDSIEERAEELNRFRDEGDIKDYVIKVHALKSSARIIGAGHLSDQAQELEDAGKAENTGYINGHHEEFIKGYMEFKEPLSVLFPENEEDLNKPEADSYMMEKAYEDIRAAAEEMDCDILESIFNEMSDYAVPAAEAELWEKLKSASDRFDYSGILLLMEGK